MIRRGEVHDAVRKASEDIPRYLFRMFHPRSANGTSLNTAERITPYAFKDQEGPASIFDIGENDLLVAIEGHITGHEVKTPFSSWSDSLASVLLIAHLTPDSHIAIIDTTALQNYIDWCGSVHMTKLPRCCQAYEYHVFGEVSGPAYQAVPYKHFKPLVNRQAVGAVSSDPIGRDLPNVIDNRKLDEIINVAKLYNENFAVVMAAHLVSTGAPVSNGNVLERLIDELPIPADLIDRPATLEQGREAMRLVEMAQRAVSSAEELPERPLATNWEKASPTLQALIKRKAHRQYTAAKAEGGRGKTDDKAMTEKGAQEDVEMQDYPMAADTQRDEGHPAGEGSTARSSASESRNGKYRGMRREVQDLGIDMIGAEEHNKQLDL